MIDGKKPPDYPSQILLARETARRVLDEAIREEVDVEPLTFEDVKQKLLTTAEIGDSILWLPQPNTTKSVYPCRIHFAIRISGSKVWDIGLSYVAYVARAPTGERTYSLNYVSGQIAYSTVFDFATHIKEIIVGINSNPYFLGLFHLLFFFSLSLFSDIFIHPPSSSSSLSLSLSLCARKQTL